VRPQLVVREVTRLGDDTCWIEARPVDSARFDIRFRIEYAHHPAIGRQNLLRCLRERRNS